MAVLGYGEPQILEVFKNTIPNRLYWILFPIDNLRVAVETAKRVLTKEKIDRQMSGQSSATSFMKASSEHNHSSMKNSKGGVTFDVIETIERNSDIIDKLTTLVSKMNMKMAKRETQYKLQIYQGRNRGQNRNRQDNYQPRSRSYNRDTNQSYNSGSEIRVGTIIGPIMEIGQETNIGITAEETTTNQMIGMTITDDMIGKTIIDKTIEETIREIGQIMEGTINRDIEIGVKVRRIQEIILETIQEKDLREIKVETDKHSQEWEYYQMKEREGQDQNLGLDPI